MHLVCIRHTSTSQLPTDGTLHSSDVASEQNHPNGCRIEWRVASEEFDLTGDGCDKVGIRLKDEGIIPGPSTASRHYEKSTCIRLTADSITAICKCDMPAGIAQNGW